MSSVITIVLAITLYTTCAAVFAGLATDTPRLHTAAAYTAVLGLLAASVLVTIGAALVVAGVA